MPDGTVTIKYIDSALLPDYIRHLHRIADSGVADSYKDGGRIVYVKLQEYDKALFPNLDNCEHIYLVYRPEKEKKGEIGRVL